MCRKRPRHSAIGLSPPRDGDRTEKEVMGRAQHSPQLICQFNIPDFVDYSLITWLVMSLSFQSGKER